MSIDAESSIANRRPSGFSQWVKNRRLAKKRARDTRPTVAPRPMPLPRVPQQSDYAPLRFNSACGMTSLDAGDGTGACICGEIHVR